MRTHEGFTQNSVGISSSTRTSMSSASASNLRTRRCKACKDGVALMLAVRTAQSATVSGKLRSKSTNLQQPRQRKGKHREAVRQETHGGTNTSVCTKTPQAVWLNLCEGVMVFAAFDFPSSATDIDINLYPSGSLEGVNSEFRIARKWP